MLRAGTPGEKICAYFLFSTVVAKDLIETFSIRTKSIALAIVLFVEFLKNEFLVANMIAHARIFLSANCKLQC